MSLTMSIASATLCICLALCGVIHALQRIAKALEAIQERYENVTASTRHQGQGVER